MLINQLKNRYQKLGSAFSHPSQPRTPSTPKLILVNQPLAQDLNLDLTSNTPQDLAALFSGHTLPQSFNPVAMAYAGHQFGHFVPQLGDGRAILLGDIRAKDGHHYDIQLKGSGRTVFSRGGDGLCPLGPALREYIISEAMHALGIPTTRSLAVVETGDPVYREDSEPGAVLTRVAKSHIRVGTFEFFAARSDSENLKKLADHVIEHYYTDLTEHPQKYLELMRTVCIKQAELVADWMSVGFIHGVMNTDNTSITAETIDYGPCAFMQHYDPYTVFSKIDANGRYAYASQPSIMKWNLTRYAETLIPLINDNPTQAIEALEEVLKEYDTYYENAWITKMGAKLGLTEIKKEDKALIETYLDLLAQYEVDYTLAFRCLSDEIKIEKKNKSPLNELFQENSRLEKWLKDWKERLSGENKSEKQLITHLNQINPLYIPRNYIVEKVLQEAQEQNYRPLEDLLTAIQNPYKQEKKFQHLSQPQGDDAWLGYTTCGT